MSATSKETSEFQPDRWIRVLLDLGVVIGVCTVAAVSTVAALGVALLVQVHRFPGCGIL